jgi:Carbohydrate-selective porin, OprB family
MKQFLHQGLLSPVLLGLAVWMAGAASAQANPLKESTAIVSPSTATQLVSAPALRTDSNSIATTLGAEPTAEQLNQATSSVEVKPGDWAYQTLQSLNAKYGCRDMPTGNRSLSREEFATSLNGCVQSIEELVARRKPRKVIKKRRVAPIKPAPEMVEPTPVAPEPAPPAPVQPPAPPEVSQQDLDQLKQLVQSFGIELQGVDARLKALDSRVTEVKDKSFSTTTKLVGEAIFAVTGLAGGPTTATRSTIFSDRVRLNFRSSFTGKDLLLVRLQSRNSNSFAGAASGTNMARLGFEGSEENTTTIHRLQYQLPLAPTTKIFVEAVGSEFNDNYYTFNPEHQAAGTGAVTRFGRFAPIYRLANEGAGIGVDHKFSPNLGLVLSYAVPRVTTPAAPAAGVLPAIPAIASAETVSTPTNGNGLFNGSNVFFSQLTLKPSDDTSLGVAYARSYNSTGTGLSGANGSNLANNPFGSNGRTLVPTTGNHYTVMGSVNLSKDLILSAWGGLTQAERDTSGKAEIWNYAATLAAKDFGSKGSTLGFVVGMQPRVASNSRIVNGVNTPGNVDKDTSMHIEAFYKYKASDNLFITPGLLILTNPEHNAANPTEYLGTIRTTFVF